MQMDTEDTKQDIMQQHAQYVIVFDHFMNGGCLKVFKYFFKTLFYVVLMPLVRKCNASGQRMKERHYIERVFQTFDC